MSSHLQPSADGLSVIIMDSTFPSWLVFLYFHYIFLDVSFMLVLDIMTDTTSFQHKRSAIQTEVDSYVSSLRFCRFNKTKSSSIFIFGPIMYCALVP